MATIEVDADEVMLLEKVRLDKKHGTSDIHMEIRNNEICDVKLTLDFRRGKEFAIQKAA